MCTLTIIPWGADGNGIDKSRRASGVRIACNRDESRMRPPARPPQIRRLPNHRALMPVDPASDGTWIGASDAPLACILMNVYTHPVGSDPISIAPRTTPRTSRGTIIPHVLVEDNLDGALERARDMVLRQFEPFRLVIVDPHRCATIEWSDERLQVTPAVQIKGPLFFTSSGLGDQEVANPRRQLFEESFGVGADWPKAQDAFHRHVWPRREHASVWMTRREARTVSLTVVELLPRSVRMSYYARENDDSTALETKTVSLPVAAGPAELRG